MNDDKRHQHEVGIDRPPPTRPGQAPTFAVQSVAQPKAMVVMCGDPRFQGAFKRFIEGDSNHGMLGLKEDEYVPLILPGSIANLTDPLALPKNFKVAREQIEFYLDHFRTIQLIVLINHEDCGGYEALKRKIGESVFLRTVRSMIEKQHVDLNKVVRALMNLSTIKARFKLFYAKFANPEHTQVVFEEVKLT